MGSGRRKEQEKRDQIRRTSKEFSQASPEQRTTSVLGGSGVRRQTNSKELTDAGVHADSFSTVALQAAIRTGRVTLSPRSTVIHDEAALASTREQHALLTAVQASGARLIEVGDPRQSQAVGAAGLWPALEHAAHRNQARVELTRNVRANDPADRRDQGLFRRGEHEQALHGYHARGRVHLAASQRHAEDRALEDAHRDRRHGRRTIVLAQTSNEHLDELNARAQAIRIEHGELDEHGIPVPGRPYLVRAGDEIQIRHAVTHPHLGGLPNGTTATILRTDPHQQHVTLQLADGRVAGLDPDQLAAADIRLAYVQHPFPAQGTTTDTAHLIVAEHATQEGSYVALTRARHATDIHAAEPEESRSTEPDSTILILAAQLGRTEPDAPSIALPLTHEQQILDEAELSGPSLSAASLAEIEPAARQEDVHSTLENAPAGTQKRFAAAPHEIRQRWPAEPDRDLRAIDRDSSPGYEI